MKNKISLLNICFLLTTLFNFAQTKIEATDIMQDIKEGKTISYKNVIIVGTLDFTFMDEAKEKLPSKKKNSWFNWNTNRNSNTIKKLIETKISFENCTFKDNVLAYVPDDDSGYTFVASFEEDAIFKSCTFERKAMFKYSKFERNADFSDTTFKEDSTFKYAKFDKNISFKNTVFEEISTFKYANFKNNVSFANSNFKDSAIFKYTKFSAGVSFKNAKFEEDLDIKYTNIRGPFDISGMNVAYDINSKYTKINGMSFNKYLVDKN